MKKIINNNSTKLYSYTGFIILIFFEIIITIFTIIFVGIYEETGILICVLLFFINYIFLRAIFIAIKYFLAIEECYCYGGKFYYRKILWYKWELKKIEIPILEIKKIKDNKKLILRTGSKYNVAYFLYYFNSYERIIIENLSGKNYYIWNYKKSPEWGSMDNLLDDDREFLDSFYSIKGMIEEEKNKILFNLKIEDLMEKYNFPLDERYNHILNKIVDEEKIFIFKKDDNFIINGDSEAIKNLEILKDMAFEEVNFYIFYINYLSKKEYENKKVLVGYNSIDGKEVTMLKLKEDINEIRDSKSSFLK